jgi:ABC-type polysaccharide/polyol phosphate transport system ATPase subunit
MSDSIIAIENVSKRYLVGHQAQQQSYHSLRDVIGREVRNFARKATSLVRGNQFVQGDTIEEFWALKDINFEVKQGEVIGIIGRNGSGKSTLLKILSRITEPTKGRIALHGRVASLLEVGTGFHPELTGRENVFLNGAILGMTRREIKRQFDEIVAFAEIEKFIDTPVKRYSSGMYVRLAFAVAAHLESDILIVDEVLAVGDAEFQKKCLGKMDNISRREGRTVLFVSHNLTIISELTQKALLLDQGRLSEAGPTPKVVSAFIAGISNGDTYVRESYVSAPHVGRAEVVTSAVNGIHKLGDTLEVRFLIRHDTPMNKACFSFQIVNQFYQAVIHAWAYFPDVRFGSESGETELICQFPALRLNVGQFSLRTYLAELPGGEIYEKLDGICRFEVVQTGQAKPWGWNATDCAYHESWSWLPPNNILSGARNAKLGS